MTDALFSALSEGEQAELQGKLSELLVYLLKRKSMGDSTSVTVEEAENMAESMNCCLQAGGGLQSVLRGDARQVYDEGLERIQEEIALCRVIYRDACGLLPRFYNQAMHDTLRSVNGFFARYDPAFSAQEIPCDIDYPLLVNVRDDVKGVWYVKTYLERLRAENLFVNAFAPQSVQRLLYLWCPDPKGLIVNLCEPVLLCAVCLALIDRPVKPLVITKEDEEVLKAGDFPPSKMERAEAVKKVMQAVGMKDEFVMEYLCEGAQRLLLRRECEVPICERE